MKKLLRNKKGFTLIELIVVILILAILAAILVPAILKYVDQANFSKGAANVRSLYSQVAIDRTVTPNAGLPSNAPSDCSITELGADGFAVTCPWKSGFNVLFNGSELKPATYEDALTLKNPSP